MRISAVLTAVICLILVIGSVPAPAADFAKLNATSVRDQAGRRIRAEKPFKRIASLYGAHTEVLYALGAGSRVAAVSESDPYPPRAGEKSTLSYRDGVERFLAVDPDLVLIRPMIERGYGRLISRLRDAGITVVSLQPRDPGETIEYWRILGVLTGKQERAEEMIRLFRQTRNKLRSLGESAEEKKQVYFEAIHSEMKTFSPQSIAMHVLRTAGGINVAKGARPVRGTNIAAYGKERILAKAEEIEVYLAQKGPMNQPTREMIKNEPGFSLIRAVRRGEIHIVNEHIVSRPAPRLLLGMYRIGRILYPERFTPELGEEVRRAIHGLYQE
ncbi:MAG: ABC transporter substrate-binding protein [Desulfohalobiaceae bacterium]